MMKIISGSCKGMPIHAPTGTKTRPSSSRVREAVMSILSHRLQDSKFMDLFAGSGSMGLEALSRGASDVYFVENDKAAIAAIKRNIEELERRHNKQNIGFAAPIVSSGAVEDVLKKAIGYAADVVWADPPYGAQEQMLDHDFARALTRICSPDAWFCLESDVKTGDALEKVWEASGAWQIEKVKRYGQTVVRIWSLKEHFCED